MVKTFPQELVDHIADHLHNDKSTLAIASTVSHSWLSACRLHLFHMLRVTNRGLDFRKFVVFLERTPYIRRYVKKISLRGKINNPILVRILSYLPHLTHLSIRGSWSLSRSATFTNRVFKMEYIFLDFDGHDFTDAAYRDNGQNQIGHDDGQLSEAIDNPNTSVTDTERDGVIEDLIEYGDDDVDDDPAALLHGQSRDYVEARALVSTLKLFTDIEELHIQLSSEPNFEWALPETDSPALIPEPEILSVHSFNISGFSMSHSTFALFRRLLQLARLQSFTVGSAGYHTFVQCRDILLNSPHLKYFSMFVRIAGHRKFFRTSLLTLPHTVPFRPCRCVGYGAGALSELTVPVYPTRLRYKWASVRQQFQAIRL